MFLQKNNDTLEVFFSWVKRTKVLLIISGVNGEMYWSNQAFQNFIKYSEYELAKLTWSEISVNDSNLEADLEMSHKCAKGEIPGYSIQKQYIPKGQKPEWVCLDVLRYPENLSSPFKFFLVAVKPMQEDSIDSLADMMRITHEVVLELKAISERLCTIESSLSEAFIPKEMNPLENIFVSIAKIIGENPKTSSAIFIIILIMILGSELVNSIETFKNLIGF